MGFADDVVVVPPLPSGEDVPVTHNGEDVLSVTLRARVPPFGIVHFHLPPCFHDSILGLIGDNNNVQGEIFRKFLYGYRCSIPEQVFENAQMFDLRTDVRFSAKDQRPRQPGHRPRP